MSTVDFRCCSWGVPIFGFGVCLFEISIRLLCSHMFEGIFRSKFGVYDPASVGIVRGAPMVNAFLRCACTARGSLDPDSKGVDAYGRVFIVALVDFGVTDDSEDCVCKVCCLFLPRGFNCRYQS